MAKSFQKIMNLILIKTAYVRQTKEFRKKNVEDK